MRRVVLVVPGLVGDVEQTSALRQGLPTLLAIAERAEVFKIAPLPPIETPETLYLGMDPVEAQMRQGPLTVSALRADPPERSTHFHLSLMSFDDGVASSSSFLPTKQDSDAIWEALAKLNTSKLTLLRGEDLDHGLVWEGLGDMGMTTAREVAGKAVKPHLPEGDADRLLRRLIDDSVNLLSELELNEQRLEEGLPPFNLLWPWGQGVRQPVPNLLFRRGERAIVESASMRLEGLTRLTGYVHEDRHLFGKGLQTKFRQIARRALARTISIIFVESLVEFRGADSEEELFWLVRELDNEFLKPLMENREMDPVRLTILAPGPDGSLGLGLEFGVASTLENSAPFDERALDERKVPTFDLARRVEAGVTLSS